jgi:parvulin-like peptidyl-prolyl isomerase
MIKRPAKHCAVPCIALALALTCGWTLQQTAWANEPYKQEWTPLTDATEDAIVASVGGQILLLSDLRRAVALASGGKAAVTPSGRLAGTTIQANEAKQVLDQLIEQSLLEIKVKELSLEVTESELDQEIAQFLQNRQISRDEFKRLLAEQSHRAEFKRQLETQRFIGRVIKPLISVSDEEVRSFYLSQRIKGASTQEKLTLRSLMIRGQESDVEVKRRLQQIQAQIQAGKSFESIVKEVSDAPDAKSSGGLLPARKASELPASVARAATGKTPGTVVGPLQIGSATFMFEIVARDTLDDAQFLREKETWKQRLLEQKFAERLGSYLKAERDKVRIEIRPLDFIKQSVGGPTPDENSEEDEG